MISFVVFKLYGASYATLHTCAQALRPLTLAQTYARTSAILVDELDAGFFKSPFNYLERSSAGLACSRL